MRLPLPRGSPRNGQSIRPTGRRPMALLPSDRSGQHLSRTPARPDPARARDQGDGTMAYGHAERTLAAIRLLEAETRELLSSLVQLWSRNTGSGCRTPPTQRLSACRLPTNRSPTARSQCGDASGRDRRPGVGGDRYAVEVQNRGARSRQALSGHSIVMPTQKQVGGVLSPSPRGHDGDNRGLGGTAAGAPRPPGRLPVDGIGAAPLRLGWAG